MAKKENVKGEVDLPKSEHQEGRFLITLAAFGVIVLISVLNFNKCCEFSWLSSPLCEAWAAMLVDQKRVNVNFVGDFFPPEN